MLMEISSAARHVHRSRLVSRRKLDGADDWRLVGEQVVKCWMWCGGFDGAPCGFTVRKNQGDGSNYTQGKYAVSTPQTGFSGC